MDTKQIIEKHREALVTIVAGLIAMIRQSETLPSPVRRQINRILRPAESALRRLIVVVAAVLSQKAQRRKDDDKTTEIQLPDFSTFATYDRLPAFPLIDPRKRFDVVKRISASDMPRIWVLGGYDRTPRRGRENRPAPPPSCAASAKSNLRSPPCRNRHAVSTG